MVRVFQVDFDFVAVIGGLLEVVVGAFGDEVAGVLGEIDISALQGAFRDEMACVLGDEFGGADGGLVGDGLVDSVVSVLRVLFLQVDLALDLEIMLESMFEGMLGSPSEVAVCGLATLGDMK